MDLFRQTMVNRHDQMQGFSQSDLERRWRQVRDIMQKEAVDIFITFDGGMGGGYNQWLAGLAAADAKYVILAARGDSVLVSYGEPVRDTAMPLAFPNAGISNLTFPLERIHPGIHQVYTFDSRTLRALAGGRVKRIGTVHAGAMLTGMRDALEESFPGAEFLELTSQVDRVKSVKSEEELELMREAIHTHEKLCYAIPSLMRVGRTFKEVCVDLTYLSQQLGANGSLNLTFGLQYGRDGDRLVHSSHLRAYPQHRFTYGDRMFVLLETCGWGGHFTALGRNFILGEPCEETVKYWTLCRKMQDFAAAMLKPGVTLREIFLANKAYIESLGYRTNEQNYIHGLGYVFIENPCMFSPSENDPLLEGMCFVVHPHVHIDRGAETGKMAYDDLYAIDTYFTTAQGGVRANAVPQELIIVK